jgi:hypothetical protein
MSTTHQYKDRGNDGKLRRKYRGKCCYPHFPSGAPKWWRKMFFTKPKRRENRRLCNIVLHDLDPEGIVFPVGNRKPHEYYW